MTEKDRASTPLGATARALGTSICRALESNGYKSAQYVDTAEEAAEAAAALIGRGASVGVPGTVTVREIGLIERLEASGCKISQHWAPGLTPEQSEQVRLEELAADWYVTSSNAITYSGMMVNIDGAGNRVAGMAWARGKILYIVGMNKACPDVESAIRRTRDIATPANAIRLGAETPCVKAGRCVDCNAPNRFCRVLTIIERAPFGRDCYVILVGEPLGY